MVTGRGAQICKYISPIGLSGLPCQVAGRIYDVAGGFIVPIGEISTDGKGIGLDGPAAGLQISAVDAQNFLRAGQVGPFTAFLSPARMGGEISAHSPVKQQWLSLR